MTSRINSKQPCLFCGQKANYYNSSLYRYVCSDPYQDCPAYDTIHQHQLRCDFCKEDNYTYYMYKIHCYELLYILDQVRPPRQRKNKPEIIKKKIAIQHGYGKCYICGKVGSEYLLVDKICCGPKATACPEYKYHMSVLFKKKYQDNPDLRIKMSEVMLEVQNRPDVKNAKSLRMLHLHNDDCCECRTFRDNYKKAQMERRGENYWKNRFYKKSRERED